MIITSIGSLIFMNKRRSVMEIFPPSVTKLWDEWEVRVLVLISLFLQIVLILLGNRRKYIPTNLIRVILWLAYLAADWIAAVCIGVLSNSQGDCEDDTSQQTDIIWAFWAPFLLLHLGGPDTITAYSMEDNELWLRHLLGLVVQFGGSFYIFLRAWKGMPLNILAIPMFVAGLIKHGERTWALRSASSSQFREAMLPRPDPGPNYAKIMGEYTLQRSQGFNVSFRPVPEPSTKVNCLDRDAPILEVGYALFKTFKRLFADLILTFQDREDSQSFFHNTTWENAFAVIEIELAFMYDVLYKKASVTYCRWSHLLRSVRICLVIITVSTFVAFLLINKHGYSTIDLIITFLLLVGAIVLEMYAIIVLLSSDWTILSLSKHKITPKDTDEVDRANKRWSNSMAQYNLMSFCLKDKPIRWYLELLQGFSYVYEMLGKHHYKSSVTVADNLKALIFQHLSDKSNELCAGRGDLVLKKEQYNCHSDLGWSVEEDFDQSILLWHIAADLLYYTDHQNQNPSSVKNPDCRTISKMVPDYMLYLLVMCPFMLPDGIGQIRFQDSCAEAKQFLEDKKLVGEGGTEASQKLLAVNTEVPPLQVKGDKNKSVLFDACRLAKSLQSLEIAEKEKWEMICDVWVEMLRGELLTHVWLLMAHFGISEHFKISQGHARSVVVVT
ncbi:hypothetical protein PVL29_006778 [Vitis rotundifolia]|uniref:DUF4220 domain-containing protein n=1 Tax=Vitis rotundifolia TaxID=103349 RepID=A0AA39A6T0_VITRO|nr:hypothetical protein PVL29_006778 [Vitis rotundifolia]